MKTSTRKRDQLAKAFLIEELKMSRVYRGTTHEDQRVHEYRERIVRAADETVRFYKMEPEQQEFAKAIILRGSNDMVALCQQFNISQGTYYNWRNHILRVFGRFAGVVL